MNAPFLASRPAVAAGAETVPAVTAADTPGLIKAITDGIANIFAARKKADTNDEDMDDIERKKKELDDDDDDDERRRDKSKSKKSKAAAADKDSDSCDDDKKKAASDDDEGDEKDDKDSKSKKARANERGRICAILGSDAGRANAKGALHLALNTNMSRNTAVALLSAMMPAGAAVEPAPRSDALRDRMAATTDPKVTPNGAAASGSNGVPPPVNDPEAVARFVIAARDKAQGKAA